MIDNIVPILTGVSIASNNTTDTARAKVGDIVTLSFTSSEAIKNVSVTIGGKAATVIGDGAGTGWTGTYVMLNTDTQGNLPISIAFKDLTGNVGTTVTSTTNSTFVRYDRTLPTLNPVMVSTNNTDTTRAISGSLVTINFTSSEGITGVSAEIGAHGSDSLVYDTAGKVWAAYYTMRPADNEGVQGININFRDSTGNIGSIVTTTSNGSSVRYDRTIPVLSNIGIVSNNANTAKAKTGDEITLTFTSSETIFTPTVFFNDTIAATTVTNISNNWTAKYTLAGAEAEGNIGFAIDFTDLAYNPGVQAIATTNSSSVIIDNIVPILTGVSIASNNTLDNARARVGEIVTLSFTSSEAIKNVSVTIDGKIATVIGNGAGTTWSGTYVMLNSDMEGNLPISIAFKDLTGNSGSAVTSTTDGSLVNFDRTTPVLNTVSISSNNANDQRAKVGDVVTTYFTSSEGLRDVTAQIGGQTASLGNDITGKIWTATYTMLNSDNEGLQSINIAFRDSTGNFGATVNVSTDASSVTFDKTGPSLFAIAIVSDNANTARAKTGDQVTLKFKSSETILIPNLFIEGNSPDTITNNGNEWSATYTIAGTEPDGIINFTIDYLDVSNNPGVQIISTTNGSSVTIDNLVPGLLTVQIYSDNATSDLAKTDNFITLAFTSTEALQNVIVNIDGQGANLTNNSAQTSWTASYQMQVTDTEGILPFLITFDDLTGNSGIGINATSNASKVTFDRTVPALTTVEIVSGNTVPGKAKVGDIITLSFNSNEGIRNVSALIGSRVAALNNSPDGKSWTATYTMQNSDVEGLLSLSISFRDSTGNTGTEVTSTTNSGGVVFDKTKPTLTSVNIASNNISNNLAKPGDQITLSFISSEGLQNVTASIAGNAATINGDGSGTIWTATYTMQNGDPEGVVPFLISFIDTVQNIGNTVSVTNDNSSVIFDRSLPVLNIVSISSNYLNNTKAKTGSVVSVTFTSSESIQNVTSSILGQAATITNIAGFNWKATYIPVGTETQGTVPFTIDFTDISGNVGLAVIAVTDGSSVEYDKTLPGLSSVSIASDHMNTNRARIGSAITVSFTSTETIEGVTVKINGKAAIADTISANNWSATGYMSSTDPVGNISFTIDYRDMAGNPGLQKTTTTNSSFVLFDKTIPGYNLVTIYSTNTNPAFAVAGDTVSLKFNTAEDVEIPNISINGFSPDTIYGGPVNWLATRIVAFGENEGIIPFTIDIEDMAGNIANTRFTTSDGSVVTFDDSNPGISSVTLTAGIYKVGDIIQLLIQSDNISYVGTTVEVNDKPQVLNNNSNNNYTINYLVEEGDNEISEAGSLPVDIVLKDPAGLTTSRTSANSLGGTISIDSHTPLIASFTSNAEAPGMAIIGDSIIFTLTPVIPETNLIIKPFSFNNSPLAWTTADGSVYTATYLVKEGDIERYTPLQPGQVILSDFAGNADTTSYVAVQKSIFTKYPTARISGTTQKCDYFGLEVPITFQFTGRKPFTLTYSNGSETIGPILLDTLKYSINASRGVFTLVNLTDSTGNSVTSALENATITVFPLPVITVDYTNSPYNIQSPPDKLSEYVIQEDKRSGVFSGEGVGFSIDAYYFYPDNIPAELLDQDISIVYTFTDSNTGCFSKDTSEVFVSSVPVTILGLKAAYCADADPVTIKGNVPAQHTGLFEVFEVVDINFVPVTSGWSQPDGATLIFNPKELPAGNYMVKYTALKLPLNEVTTYYSEKNFTIEEIRTNIHIIGLDSVYCYDKDGIELDKRADISIVPGTGDIGKFFGPDVFTVTPDAHFALFKLSAALADSTYTLNYIYKSNNGCIADTVSHTLSILPLPVLSFNVLDNYNLVEQDTIPLIGNSPAGNYSFSGEGILNDTLFSSLARINIPIKVTYSGTDPNSCYNEVTDTTIIYKATAPIDNLSAVYCFSNNSVGITCTPKINNIIYTGTFGSARNALVTTGNNSARYYIDRVGSGKDSVYFDYNVNGTGYSVYKIVFVDSIGAVNITSNPDITDYCKDLSKVTFTGSPLSYSFGGQGRFDYDANPSPFGNTYELFPPQQTTGPHIIKYTFTSNYNCTSVASLDLNIYPVPTAAFEVPIACPDIINPVQLINKSTPDTSTITWLWKIEGEEDTVKSPVHLFKSNGTKRLELTATSDKGCSNTKQMDVIVGNFALADFKWNNDCNSGDDVLFTSTSSGGIISDYKWKLNESFFPGTATATNKFSAIGPNDVELIIMTNDGCSDSITRQIVIQPYIKLQELPYLIYYQNFESGNSLYNWQATGLTDSDVSRWTLGTPDGTIINTASSGNFAWYTKINEKTDVENSQVVSPCFNLTGLEKPMIKLNIWSSSEFKRDGAVLQYSTDAGETWKNLGSTGEGIGWFDSENIQSQPGGDKQFNGWNEKPMTTWNSARHNLDSLKNSTNVRFRIAYAADGGGVSKVDGFAFDDVWIGDRQQNVLTEYFTNTNVSASLAGNEYLKTYEAAKAADLVPIHYHTGNPSGDLLYKDYTEGPSSRVFYYGVSQTPNVFSNGTNQSSLNSATAKTTFEKLNDVETLKDPDISLNLNVTQSTATVSITAQKNLAGENLILFAAIVKDSVEVGGVYYYNVLRKFLPDAGGISIPTAGFTSGQTISESIPVNLGSNPEFIGSNLVVFVQNSITRQVYQSVLFKLTATTDIRPENINNMVDIYPNPVTEILFIDCMYNIGKLEILDISGRIVTILEPDQKRLSIPVQDLKYGVYIIRGKTEKGEFMKKFIKQ